MDTTQTAATSDSTPATPATPAAPTTNTDTSPATPTPSVDASTPKPADGGNSPETVVEYPAPEVPEGLTLDDGFLTDFTNIAKESGLSPEQFKKMTDMGAKMAGSIMAKAQEANQQRIDNWRQQTEADKDIGGEKLAENLSIAKRAMETFGSPELSAVLEESGLGNHPAVIKALVKIGRGVSEDSLVPGGAQSPSPTQTIAQQLYPNMNP